MADGWSVPIYPGVLTGLNDVLAQQGKDRFNWLGQLPENYWAGQQQGYQRGLQTMFEGGLPQATGGGIDFTKMGTQIIQKAGMPGVQQGLGLINLDEMLRQEAARGGQPYGGGDFSGTSGTPTSSPSISGTPAVRTPATSSDLAGYPGRDDAASQGVYASPREIAARNQIDPQAFADVLGKAVGKNVDLDQKLPLGSGDVRNWYAYGIREVKRSGATPSDTAQLPGGATTTGPDRDLAYHGDATRGLSPDASQTKTAALGYAPSGAMSLGGQPPSTQAFTPQAAPLVPPTPQRFAQAQAPALSGESPGFTQVDAEMHYQNAKRLESDARSAALRGFPDLAKQRQAEAQQEFERAQKISDAVIKNRELPPEAKLGILSGEPSPRQYQATTEQDKLNIAAFGKENDAVQRNAASSSTAIQEARLGKNLTLQPGFYSGPLYQNVQLYNQFKSQFGSDPGRAMPQEAMQKVANSMLIEQIRGLASSNVGRINLREVQAMKNSIANLEITPTSNRAILELASRVHQMNIDIGTIARNIDADPRIQPQQKNAAFQQAAAQYREQHPMFTSQELRDPKLLGAPDAPPESANWSPQQKRAWAATIGLKPRDHIRFNTPDGRSIIGVVP